LATLALCSLLAIPLSAGNSADRGRRLLALSDKLETAEAAVDNDELQRAAELYVEALSEAEEVGATLHLARSVDGLADVRRMQGRLDEATPLYERSIPLWQELLGPDQPRQAVSEHNLATIYLTQGRLDNAEPLLRHALATFERSFGPDSSQAVNTRRAYHQLRNRMDAEPTAARQ
jgi:tetratricopeptide (TPR) repeat protein